jgi:hypothetical protein
MSIQEAALKASNDLIKSALKKKRWTPAESKQWSRAFNALRKLANET